MTVLVIRLVVDISHIRMTVLVIRLVVDISHMRCCVQLPERKKLLLVHLNKAFFVM